MIFLEEVNTTLIVNLSYILSSMLFIFGLKMLGSPETARKGNLLSSSGMFLAIVVTLLDQNIVDFSWLAAGLSIFTLPVPSAMILKISFTFIK